MFRLRLIAAACIAPFSLAACQTIATSAGVTPAEQTAAPSDAAALAALVEDYEAFRLETDVAYAAREGDMDAKARWPDLSPRALESAASAIEAFKARHDVIDAADLDRSDAATHAVLGHVLAGRLLDAQFETQRLPFTNDSGFHTIAGFAALATRVRTIEEAEAWIARLEALPAFLAQNKAWLAYGIETGWTQPAEIVPGVIEQIEAQIAPDPAESPLLNPITTLPPSVPETERARLRAEAETVVRERVNPAYAELAAFMRETYLPAARETFGARAMPGGEAYYAALVRDFTTLDVTPEEIHQTGLEEVARIRAEMDAVIAGSGFDGTFAEFLTYLRTDPQFYAQTEYELLAYAAYLSKKADDAMPSMFRQLPRLGYGVRAVPASIAPGYTTARYWPGDAESGVAGGYMVNTYRLDQRPLYEMPSLTLHEAVPGHHHQIALAQELEDVPDFRRQTFITAFGEGWALYAEHVGLDMDMYSTPYEHFGRLTYEMWRACRLIIDTGLHWYGWSREEAEACLLENSALAPFNIRNEISRYISWPGQALAYKPGELLIRELRAEAQAELGEAFDLRAFHDEILADGALPLTALEAKMREWIEDQRVKD